MEYFPPVVFEVKAQASEAIAAFGTINKQLALMEKEGLLASTSITRLETAARAARTMVLGLGGAFAILGVASLETLDRVEKSQTNLEVAIKNTGVSFEAALPYIKNHADSMKQLGFTYEDTYAALAKMTAASGSPQTALNSLSVAADLARAKNMSLADAGSIIARASVGAARGLADLGLKIGVTIPKGASLATILKLIEDRVGGAANAFGNTLGGKIAVAKANFQALEVEIGTKLLPSAIKLTDWISNVAIPKMGEFFNFIKNNQGVIKTLGLTLAAIWTASKITAGVQAAIAVIKTLIATYNALKVAAGLAYIAESAATGGAAVALGVAGAAAATAALYGFSKAAEWAGGSGAAAVGGYGAVGGPKSMSTGTVSLAGKGVQKVPSPTPSPSAHPTVTNITIHASDTNDIARKMAKATKGLPLGGK